MLFFGPGRVDASGYGNQAQRAIGGIIMVVGIHQRKRKIKGRGVATQT